MNHVLYIENCTIERHRDTLLTSNPDTRIQATVRSHLIEDKGLSSRTHRRAARILVVVTRAIGIDHPARQAVLLVSAPREDHAAFAKGGEDKARIKAELRSLAGSAWTRAERARRYDAQSR